MGNLLFSPSGRINSEEFMRGAYVLVAVTFLINLLPMVSVTMGGILKLLLVVTYYCWIALFIKRFHDGGKSGWMTLVPIVVFGIGSMILSQAIPPMFAPELYNNMQEALIEAMESGGGMGAIMGISKEFAEPLAKKIALPSSFGFALMSLAIAFGFNAMIKQEPNENKYGPAR